jgi:hypothetical protein
MRPSRTTLQLAGIAFLAAAVKYWIQPLFRWIDASASPETTVLVGSFAAFVAGPVAFVLAYLLGRRGQVGPPRQVAGTLVLAGVVASSTAVAVRYGVRGMEPFGWILWAIALDVLRFTALYTFACLAGIPLGVMAREASETAVPGPTDSSTKTDAPRPTDH